MAFTSCETVKYIILRCINTFLIGTNSKLECEQAPVGIKYIS